MDNLSWTLTKRCSRREAWHRSSVHIQSARAVTNIYQLRPAPDHVTASTAIRFTPLMPFESTRDSTITRPMVRLLGRSCKFGSEYCSYISFDGSSVERYSTESQR